jgi:isoleucyl-tRNA synthetase
MFKPVASKMSFPEMEECILRFWKEGRIFERSVEERAGAAPFILYEGPPTANGSPGIHHVLSRVFKDVIPRFRTMKGYWAPRRAGWDTHGLPVELEIERELGLTSKNQIEEYGVAKFNARCRESVFRYLKEWESLTERIGFWVDMEHPYVTMKNEYIESCWWIIKSLWDRGLIYQGHRVTPHCPRCGTSLSSHEVSLGYRDDAKDPSIYVKFKLDLSMVGGSDSDEVRKVLYSEVPTYFLAWTTTPWTLPGNTALALALDAEYALVEMESTMGDKERLILARELLPSVLREDYSVMATFAGRELVGFRYQPLFDPARYDVGFARFLKKQSGQVLTQPSGKFETWVIAGDFVSLTDGTGIVHIAPAFGEVDYEAGKQEELFYVQQVDLQGKITGTYPFSGKFVKEADPLILDDLKSRGLLYRSETIQHTYPFCWRCDAPLLYYAKPSWYIRTTALKEKLISRNEEINWYPEHIKHGRFGDWLENNVDWAFSRERYWGTPLPIWQCQECQEYECVASRQEMKGKPGLQGWQDDLDLHRPFIDGVSYRCARCGGTMRRVPDVMDCWFDSGAMPVAQWHYPFFKSEVNKTYGVKDKESFEPWFPAGYICEAVDQTRGWFYTLHAISTLVFDRPCFKNVICLGHILDAKGEKMSKARGNVVEPWAVIGASGADALRWYMLTASPPGNVRRFSTDQVTQVFRKFLLTLWHTYSFFVTYANIDHFDPNSAPPSEFDSELDRWILSELNLLIHQVDTGLENYDPTGAGRRIEEFVDSLSNWYVRRSRRRFWKSENDADKQAAYHTLYRCLVTLSKLLAPFTPFVGEELYQNLVRSVDAEAAESVHLADFPVADLSQVDEALSANTQLAMKVSSLGRAARSQARLKVRQPLAEVLVKVRSGAERKGLEEMAPQILEELNVKALKFMEEVGVADNPDFSVAQEGGYVVAMSTRLTPELAAEGRAREIVHRLQTMRRSAGFDIADHIITYYQGEASLETVMRDFAPYIEQETLSRHLEKGVPEDAYRETHRLDGEEIVLGVKKLD